MVRNCQYLGRQGERGGRCVGFVPFQVSMKRSEQTELGDAASYVLL